MSHTKSYSMANPIHEYTETIDLGAVAANTSEEETLTVTGVTTDDRVLAVVPPSLEAGLMVGPCRITADDTVALTVMNATASSIDHTSEASWIFVVAKG